MMLTDVLWDSKEGETVMGAAVQEVFTEDVESI